MQEKTEEILFKGIKHFISDFNYLQRKNVDNEEINDGKLL